MARRLRCFIHERTLHVTQRGNNRGLIFRAPSDYDVFLSTLRHIVGRYELRVHAYVLMSNHFHLLVTPESELALPRAMQAIAGRYAPFFNRRYERTGGLWEGRHRIAFVQDDRHWLTCLRYVELNPVRAGIVSLPEHYKWSSYRAHAFGVEDPLVSPHPLYTALGRTPERRQENWRNICGSPIEPDTLDRLRMSIRRGFVSGEPFLHEVEEN